MARIVPLDSPLRPHAVRGASKQNHTNIPITMKLIKVISLGLAALILGACASKPSQQPTVATTTSGSYVVPAK